MMRRPMRKDMQECDEFSNNDQKKLNCRQKTKCEKDKTFKYFEKCSISTPRQSYQPGKFIEMSKNQVTFFECAYIYTLSKIIFIKKIFVIRNM